MTFVQNSKREKNENYKIPWHVALYVRLSKEDGDKIESDSIQNQKRIIEQHLKHLREQGKTLPPLSPIPTTVMQAAASTAPATRE